MNMFDLHCDTALELYRHGYSLADAPCAVSLAKAAGYDRYVQLMAVFTDTRLDDEGGWQQFSAVRENLLKECETHAVPLCRSGAELGYPPAENLLGTCYYYGYGIDKDEKTGFLWSGV